MQNAAAHSSMWKKPCAPGVAETKPSSSAGATVVPTWRTSAMVAIAAPLSVGLVFSEHHVVGGRAHRKTHTQAHNRQTDDEQNCVCAVQTYEREE